MRRFVIASRTLPFSEFSDQSNMKLDLVVKGPNRLPRRIKKKIKWMANRVSTVEILDYIIENEEK